MQFLLIIGGLVVMVLLCEKFKAHLPFPIRQIYGLWERFAHVVGIVMSTMILSVFWFVVIGIYAVILKCAGLFRNRVHSETYWIPSEPQTTQSMERQF